MTDKKNCPVCGGLTPRPSAKFCNRACMSIGFTKTLKDAIAVFPSMYRKTDSCWIFNKVDGLGYGHIRADKKHWYAHRLSWYIYHGRIPRDLDLCHKCDNPSCVNPAHLFLGTHDDNMKDMAKKKRAVSGNWGNKLTYKDAVEIRKSELTRAQLAKKYKVSVTNIANIKNNIVFKKERYENNEL